MKSTASLKTFFFGSSEYCLPILEQLREHTHLVGIVTREDKPVGRKKILEPSSPKQYAKKWSIPTFTPRDKNELLNTKDELKKLLPDIAIVADYGLIIPKDIFTFPRLQTVNIHFSKLPDLRGASPVQCTILRGDTAAWITIQDMAKALDTGAILWQKEVPVGSTIITPDLYAKLFEIASLSLPDILHKYASKEIIPVPQDNTQATYTRRLTRDDGFIPWEILHSVIFPIPDRNSYNDPGSEQLRTWPLYNSILQPLYPTLHPAPCTLQQLIDRVFRAFSPWPGLWTELVINGQKKRLKIINAHLELTTNDQRPTTRFVIHTVQLEGKQPISWEQFRDMNQS